MLSEATAYLIAQLQGLGISAASDARNLSIPGVLVTPAGVTPLLDGSADVRLRLLLIVPDNGQHLTALDHLLEVVGGDAEAVTAVMPNHAGSPLPALEIVHTVTVTKE